MPLPPQPNGPFTDPDPDGDHLDGCAVDMGDPAHRTQDGEQATALALFADVQWDDPAEVDRRTADLAELAAAGLGPGDLTRAP